MMNIKNRFFVSPQNGSDENPTMDDFKAAFGIKDVPPASDPPAADPPADPTPSDPPSDPQPSDPPSNPQDPPKADPPAGDKTAQAFAQQRIQIKQYQNLINGVAKILGVTDTSNPEAVTSKINDLILKAEAKANNVPEDVYKRLQTLETQNQEYTQKQVRETAYFGFQKVKDTFKLDDAGLNKFADDLVASGMNPFENPVDLVKEYRLMHFDDLMKAAVAEGIRQEAERSAKAQQFSSTPNNKQGQGGADPEKITTVAGLTAWFDKQGQK